MGGASDVKRLKFDFIYDKTYSQATLTLLRPV